MSHINANGETLEQLTKRAEGITKHEIAVQLDAANCCFSFLKPGLCHYSNYTRPEMLELCFSLLIDPVSDYHKKRAGII